MKQQKQIFKFQKFSKKQRMTFNWWCPSSPVRDYDGIIADGAIRSGKTLCMSLSYVMWAMYTFNGQNFGMCGKTIGSFRRNVLYWLKLMLNSRGYTYTDHRADNLLIVTRGKVTNYFYIFGGKDERSQDLIQGITLAGCFFDEVALMPESFVNQATGRCSVAGSKFWFNCNPDGPYHWFKVNWIDRSTWYLGKKRVAEIRQKAAEENKEDGLKEILYLHFTMDDNLSLSEEIKARYRSLYTGVFFNRYILGMWCVAEGIIYDMFSKERHVVEEAGEPLTSTCYVSCDYGTQNATVFLMWRKGVSGKWYCTKEYYYSGRDKQKQKTDKEYANDFVRFLDGRNVRAVIVDPAAASFIAELRERGYSVIPAKNDVEDGIRYVGTLLNTCEILFYESCGNTIQEYSTYSWDKKAADHGEDKPVKERDHCMDAVRYFCYTVLFASRAKIKDKKQMGFD